VALAIFLFALVGIGHLVTLSGDRALDVQQQGRAAQLCQSKLAEVLVGAVPLTSQSDVPFDEDPDWTWSLDAEPHSVSGLWQIQIKAGRQRSDGTRVESSVSQLVLDPSLRGSSADAAATAQAAADSTSSDSSSSGSQAGGSGGASQGAGGAAASKGASSKGGSGAKGAAPSQPSQPAQPAGGRSGGSGKGGR
jgi:hypothetical protein